MEFQLTLGPDEVRALSYAVNEAIRMWPGSPARAAEEQEILYSLKNACFTMQMEMVFHEEGKRSEGESRAE